MPSNTYTFAEAVNGLGKDKYSVATSIPAVPATAERRPFYSLRMTSVCLTPVRAA